jgi:hypothetical protein
MNQNEPQEEEEDWFDQNLGTWLLVAVVCASLVIPAIFWVASKLFGWEPPEFLMDWIDFFAA